MWWLAWIGFAVAGNPYLDREGDVVASARVAESPAAIVEHLADLPRAAGLFGEGCLVRWQVGTPESGVGARARVTYTPHLMNRRLTLEVTGVEPGAEVEWDHEGPRGFVTVWTVAPVPGGSEVTVRTLLDPPGWPLRRLFFEDIHPAWTACYARALRALGRPWTPADAPAPPDEAAADGLDAPR